MFIISKITHY